MDTQTLTAADSLTAADYKRISDAITTEFDNLFWDIDPEDDASSLCRSDYELDIQLSDDDSRCITIYADLELCYHTTANELDYYGGTGYCGETLVDSWDVTINHARLYDESFDDWIPVDVDRAMLNLD